MLSVEATNNNFIVFGFTWSGFKCTIYRPRGEHSKICNHFIFNAKPGISILFKCISTSLFTGCTFP